MTLATRPVSPVTLNITTSDFSEAIAAPTVLRFTPDNFATTQEVVVTGVEDDIVEGDVSYTVSISVDPLSDPAYTALDPVVIAAVNEDQAEPALIITGPDVDFTTEAGGEVTVGVRLSRPPTGDVEVSIASSDIGEGVLQTSVLTFTPANGSVPQTVTIVGVDDDLDDGDVEYQINFLVTRSADPSYLGLTGSVVALTNRDDDTAGPLRPVVGGGAMGRPSRINLADFFDPGQSPIASTVRVVSPPANGSVGFEGNRLTFTPAAGFVGRDSFRITVGNSQGGRSIPFDVNINVVSAFLQNPLLTADVNRNGEVSALDALLIINRLNATAGGRAEVTAADFGPGASREGVNESLYFDVSGDNAITALDALRVINEINRLGNPSE